jgi:SecY translocase
MPLARLATTAVGCAAFLMLRHVQVPLLSLPSLEGGVPLGASVGALGLEPILFAWIAVETAATLVPRWRALRVTNRATLDRVSVALAVLVALVEAFGSARYLEAVKAGRYPAAIVFGAAFIVPVVATLVGGVCAALAISWFIDQHGIGRGMSILLAAEALTSLPSLIVRYQHEEFGPKENLALVVAVGGTMLILAAGGRLRLPVSGLDPVLRPLRTPRLARVVYGIQSLPVRWLVRGGLIMALTAALAYLFNAEENAARRAALPSAIARTVVYLVVMELLLVYFPIDLLGLATAAAVAMDVAAELRLEITAGKLVAVRRIQKPDHADDLIGSLREAGIPAVAQGAFHRTLLQFFGPFIPVDILVPAEQAARAAAVVGLR